MSWYCLLTGSSCTSVKVFAQRLEMKSNLTTSSMHNMFGASVSEVYNIIWCQFDLKIDNLNLMIGKRKA